MGTEEIITSLDLGADKKLLDHGIGSAIEHMKRLNIYPSEIGLDRFVLAAHVYAADTRISRATESQDSWTLEIRLVVPVSDPSRWAAVSNIIIRMLDFLTCDRWSINFRPRPSSFTAIIPEPLKEHSSPPFDSLSLFSGGLDSLIGAVDILETGLGSPLFISHSADGATSNAQSTCFEALKKYYAGRAFERLRVWMNFPDDFVHDVMSEKTTRGRSFLFFAIGIFAGTGLHHSFVLRVPENGLISLNVPLDPLRLGALSTRTTHPFYMARWNDLISALGIPGRVENPYWNKTKGEMVTNCANRSLLLKLIPEALSCSSPTKGRWQGRGIEHCGYCLPCIIRRAAIFAALGQGADPTTYTLSDLTARVLNSRSSEGQQIRSFQFAIDGSGSIPHLQKSLSINPGLFPMSPLRISMRWPASIGGGWMKLHGCLQV
jgi:hypothetical protein